MDLRKHTNKLQKSREGKLNKVIYTDLVSMRRKQLENLQQWEAALVNAALNFRDVLEEELEFPESAWVYGDNAVVRQNVELHPLESNLDKPFSGELASSINEKGELVLNVVVFLRDTGFHCNPCNYVTTIALKYQGSKLKYHFWDNDQNALHSEFKPAATAREFSQSLIKLLVNFLSYNPFEGDKSEREIGFLAIIK